MDNEILEILKDMKSSIQRLESKIDDNTKDIKDLKDGQQRIENKLEITYSQVARTAENVTDIKKDLIFVEEATSKNWNDIAKLKAIK